MRIHMNHLKQKDLTFQFFFHKSRKLIIRILSYKINVRTNSKNIQLKLAPLIISFLILTLFLGYLCFKPTNFNYQLAKSEVVKPKDVINVLSLPKRQIEDLELEKSFLDDSNDKRLSSALALYEILQHLSSNNHNLDPNFELPFSWRDWSDLEKKLKTPKSSNKQDELTCDSLRKAAHSHEWFGVFKSLPDLETCVPLNGLEVNDTRPSSEFPPFKITGPDTKRFPTSVRVAYGAAYLYYTDFIPERLIFTGINSDNYNDRTSILQVKLKHDEEGDWLINSIENYRTNEDKNNISINEMRKSINLSGETKNLKFKELKYNLNERDITAFLKTDSIIASRNSKINDNNMWIAEDEFQWNIKSVRSNLDKRVRKLLKIHGNDYSKIEDYLDYKLSKKLENSIANYPDKDFPKSFCEASNFRDPGVNGDHHDWRFFEAVKDDFERRTIIHHMNRAWFRFANSVGIRTWIAHGTLLGFYFNGLSLSWDTDSDVQVTMDSLYKLARNFNSSLIIDVTAQNPDSDAILEPFRKNDYLFDNSGYNKYYLEVGESFYSRNSGNGKNAIDARFINIETGHLIDITAVAHVTPTELQSYSLAHQSEDDQDNKPFGYLEQTEEANPDLMVYLEPTDDHMAEEVGRFIEKNNIGDEDELMNRFDVVHCKHFHYYHIYEVSPLIPVLMEGTLAYIPYKSKEILELEYPKMHKVSRREDYTYKKLLRTWVSDTLCSRFDSQGTWCKNDLTMLEYSLTKDYTKRHQIDWEYINNHHNLNYKNTDEYNLLYPDLGVFNVALDRIKSTTGN
ncbi:hypothetical protein BVG19_g2943 [[Candida] boidinii]|nr:hypothetical protein BVG19_g2943 [[Candida] boidinii]OWB50406.1 hypothetical protein B5S27_g1956 [[Candida] boidinii]